MGFGGACRFFGEACYSDTFKRAVNPEHNVTPNLQVMTAELKMLFSLLIYCYYFSRMGWSMGSEGDGFFHRKSQIGGL